MRVCRREPYGLASAGLPRHERNDRDVLARVAEDGEFGSLAWTLGDHPAQIRFGPDGVELSDEFDPLSRIQVIQDPTCGDHRMTMSAGALDERPDVGNCIPTFDSNPTLTTEIDRSDETIESFDLLRPDARFQPTDLGVVEQIDRAGIESLRPHHTGYMMESGRATSGLALQRESSVFADEVSRLNVVVDVRKQQSQSGTTADVDAGDVSDLRPDHCEGKQKPIAASDFVGLRRSRRQQMCQIFWVFEDEASESLRRILFRGPIIRGLSEIWKVLPELLIGIVQDEEVDAGEEENWNSLYGLSRSHQIEYSGLSGRSFGKPTVERCCTPKGA